jgi:hypothetical protein
MQPDEPDLHNVDPTVLIDQYTTWKKAAPNLPVFLNVSGGALLFRKTPRDKYPDYFRAADWIGNDFYPISGWNQPTWIPRLGEAIDLCRDLSRAKPQFAFVETSNQQLAWLPKETRGPTPDQTRAEIWTAIIHGAKGIIYFPQQFNPFKYDATPSAVSIELAKQNRLLEKLSPILALPNQPKGMKVTVMPPLEATWRVAENGTAYVIVLNLSPTAAKGQVIKLTGVRAGTARVLSEDGRAVDVKQESLTDDLTPYGAAVYALDP